MTSSSLPRNVVVLCRISDDKAEEQKGVGRQEDDCRERAARLGWNITEVVVENDTSAFKRRRIKLLDGTTALRVIRPGFRRVLDLLASGEADALIAYDLDRVARDPRDLEDLIDIVEARKAPVESVTGSLRLSNDAEVTMARVMVAIANKSSRDTSRRVARTHQQLAAEGKPGGGGLRPYGYQPDRLTVVEAEAEIIREIAASILADKTLYAIVHDLNDRGVPSATGGVWTSRSITSVVTKARVAGLRATGTGAATQIVGPAVWPAILDREAWEAVCATLATRGKGSQNVLKRWLNGCFWCSLCGAQLHGWQGGTRPRYWCATPRGGCGKIAIDALHAEEAIGQQLIDYLSHTEVLTRLRSLTDSDGAKTARQELAADEAQLKEMAGAYAQRLFTLAEYIEARKIVESRVKSARALLVAAAPRILRSLLAKDVAAGWEELDPAEKREVALAVLPDGWEVTPFAPAPGQRRIFDGSRIRKRELTTGA
ncbi:recombinase family protein [Streptomyces sp. CB03911]|uniref:recombinase family protein n=1 Tax=Streptomyces sp. CB03911 TaxID=1804758 RepID=UPI00093DD26F|nr:recombinase family protein [Streptomyces sp. CB03911]OKI14248.1 hypothetical protein A6A07_13955 [Streptomyces sp. CB03911]